MGKLSKDDFHHKITDNDIKITVTFYDLSNQAKADLSHYVRQDKLIVTASAKYDPSKESAEVEQYGNRLGFTEFISFFEAVKVGKKAPELKDIFFKVA